MQSNEYFSTVQQGLVKMGFALISRISITGKFYDENVAEARSTNLFMHWMKRGLIFNLECLETDGNQTWNIQTVIAGEEEPSFNLSYLGTGLQNTRKDRTGVTMRYYMSSLRIGMQPKVQDLLLDLASFKQLPAAEGNIREIFLPPFIPTGYFPDCMDSYMEQLDKPYLRHIVYFIAGVPYDRYFGKKKAS